jgi:hypothetical protein
MPLGIQPWRKPLASVHFTKLSKSDGQQRAKKGEGKNPKAISKTAKSTTIPLSKELGQTLRVRSTVRCSLFDPVSYPSPDSVETHAVALAAFWNCTDGK